MPYPRSGMAFASDGKLIYMSGGEYLNRDMVGVFRNAEAYDPARNAVVRAVADERRAPRFCRRHHQRRLLHRDRPAAERHGGGGPGGSPQVEGFIIGKPAAGGTR